MKMVTLGQSETVVGDVTAQLPEYTQDAIDATAEGVTQIVQHLKSLPGLDLSGVEGAIRSLDASFKRLAEKKIEPYIHVNMPQVHIPEIKVPENRVTINVMTPRHLLVLAIISPVVSALAVILSLKFL